MRTAAVSGQMHEQSGATSTFTWEDDLRGNIPEFHKVMRSANSVHAVVSGHGSAGHQEDGKNRSLPPQVSWGMPPLHLPGVVLSRELNNPLYSLRIVADESGLMHIRTAWKLNSVTASVTAQDWFFDPVTNLPAKVQYLLPNTLNPSRKAAASLVFGDFRAVSGVLAPFNLTGYGADRKIRTFMIQDLKINVPIDPTHFELNGGQQ